MCLAQGLGYVHLKLKTTDFGVGRPDNNYVIISVMQKALYMYMYIHSMGEGTKVMRVSLKVMRVIIKVMRVEHHTLRYVVSLL